MSASHSFIARTIRWFHPSMMDEIDKTTFANALNRLLKRFADAGWLASATITEGHIGVTYTARGLERMETLRDIITKELGVALRFDEFQALMALIIALDQSDAPPPAAREEEG